MQKWFFIFLLGLSVLGTSCSDDDDDTTTPNEPDTPELEVPETYSFLRNGESTVDFSGQTTRLRMGAELNEAMLNFDMTDSQLLEMYRNETNDGAPVDPFSEAALNESDKSLRGKVAASRDFFSANTAESMNIKNEFESWIKAQVAEIFPAQNQAATVGQAGQLADGGTTRYVNANGLEFDQAVGKGMIGALVLDQIVNNYVSTSVLDEANNRSDNESETLVEGTNYTNMEHKWDEAYGYVFGNSPDGADPLSTLGADDDYLNKYIGRVEGDDDFAGIGQEIFDAFKRGRAAIVAGDYEERDVQADIIREKLSEVIAIRAVYYLQQAKITLPQPTSANQAPGTAFHDLSEGFGFIYSLRFTRQPGTDAPYFSAEEVQEMLDDVYFNLDNGFWDLTNETIDQVSDRIAAKFDFTVAQAGS